MPQKKKTSHSFPQAVEQKYQAVKSINSALEGNILQLRHQVTHLVLVDSIVRHKKKKKKTFEGKVLFNPNRKSTFSYFLFQQRNRFLSNSTPVFCVQSVALHFSITISTSPLGMRRILCRYETAVCGFP